MQLCLNVNNKVVRVQGHYLKYHLKQTFYKMINDSIVIFYTLLTFFSKRNITFLYY